ncbi:MAG TPA: metal ABC transporter substrate-binding protein [Candidatus Limnocylindria bacterium]|nr:metal ABC transporter substrate-binding protein [Candidatus Limnocylindria bacterium]
MRSLMVVMLAAFLAMPLAGCGFVGGGGPQVLATTTILADMTKQVAGDRMTVGSIVPAGGHVEEYEPRPDDARRVSDARLIVTNGLDLDVWVEPLLRNAKSGTPVVVVTDGLADIDGNPHMWFDPALARGYVEAIRDALIALDPQERDAYTSRAKAYTDQLVSLESELQAKVATIPADRRKLVTSHDAFPYLAEAFGFEIVGFAEPEPGKPPSAGELAGLVEKVRAAKVPAIFSEAGGSSQLAETVAKETGAKVVTDLPTDSLLERPADSYIGLMRVAVDKIVAALK